MSQAFLGLGANLGDRADNLRQAIDHLAVHPAIRLIRISPIYETEPFGVTSQPMFLNAVVEVDTDLPPEMLLDYCLRIENDMGRTGPTSRQGPRCIDIDLLWFDDREMHTVTLTLPHPRMLERRFVLQPLSDIAPKLRIYGKSVSDYLSELTDSHLVRPFEEPLNLAGL